VAEPGSRDEAVRNGTADAASARTDDAASASTDDAVLRPYYAARAESYDRIYTKPERQADLARLRERLPPHFAGARVIEVACGTGWWTQFIAPVAASVLALDSEAETLAVARRRQVRGQVEFLVGDAYALPRDRGPFDAAFAGFWFSHVPRRRRREFLAGLRDVLGGGATVVMLDNRYVEGSSSPLTDHDAEGNTYQTRRLDDGSSHRVLKNFPDVRELEDEVAGVGLAPVVESLEYYWTLRYASAAPR
jgi:demethylmenaquinone methyltransferase/2-methoxy-6-polyprenyl-1,4-benzoquinol methylase